MSTGPERPVIEYAEATTRPVPTVTDELTRSLARHLGEAAFVELTTMIAVENLPPGEQRRVRPGRGRDSRIAAKSSRPE